MITDFKKSEILSLLQGMENTLTASGQSIRDICANRIRESCLLLKSNDSLAPILRTALVINWREAAMISRYNRFRTEFPDVSCLSHLKNIIDNHHNDVLGFCRVYLNISPNPNAPHKNPKYNLLKELTNGFLGYKEEHGFATEIGALRDWCLRVDISNVKKDYIGKIKGVGIGVIENIRLNLGYSVIKPDRHVIGVMQSCFKVDIPVDRYNDFSTLLGIDRRYLDCILFEYGKLKGISTSTTSLTGACT